MRIFFLTVAAVLLFALPLFAQTELTLQAFAAGVSAAESGQYDKALRHFERALEKSKFSTDLPDQLLAKINYNAGVCHYRLNRASEAIEFFNLAVRLAKNKYPQALRALGMARAALADWRAAETAFLLAVRLDKRDGESWFDLGTVYLAENDLRGAAVAFQKAVLYNSVDAATAHNNLGVISARDGNWLEAKKQFETALAKSGGKLPEAARNLNLCRSSNFTREMIAKLEFINTKSKEN